MRGSYRGLPQVAAVLLHLCLFWCALVEKKCGSSGQKVGYRFGCAMMGVKSMFFYENRVL